MTKAGRQLVRTMREVRATDTTRGVLLSRTFPASVTQLWRACTEKDSLARWIGHVSGDPAEGSFDLIMDPASTSSCEILRCEPPHRLELVWTLEGESSVVTASINATPDGAELTIEHFALRSPGGLGYGPGWEELMIDLEEFLDGDEKQHDCAEAEEEAQGHWRDVKPSDDDRFGHVDGQGRYVKINNFGVPPRRVWEALTLPNRIGGWFGEVSGDLKLGGDWRVSFGDGFATGTVMDCDQGTSFTTTFVQGIDDAATGTHLVKIELAPVDLGAADGTRLTLTHTYADQAGGGVRRGMAAGWHAYLAALGRRLAGRETGEDAWMVDFRIAGMVTRPLPASAE